MRMLKFLKLLIKNTNQNKQEILVLESREENVCINYV